MNTKSILAWLSEQSEADREFAYKLIDRLCECGACTTGGNYFRDALKAKQIRDKKGINERAIIYLSHMVNFTAKNS